MITRNPSNLLSPHATLISQTAGGSQEQPTSWRRFQMQLTLKAVYGQREQNRAYLGLPQIRNEQAELEIEK